MSTSKKHEMEVANFTAKFGERNLIDYVEKLFLPAITNRSLKRKYGKTDYFLEKVSIDWLGEVQHERVAVISGRLIKNTVLSREQVYKPSVGLVESAGELESAPSALFALILNNHRLLYVKETQYAPGIDEFRTTIQSLVRQQVRLNEKAFKEERRAAKKRGDEIETYSDTKWAEVFPAVNIRITHLASQIGLNDFLKEFSKLESVRIKLLVTNHEPDFERMFSDFRDAASKIESDQTVIEYKNKSDGLSKDVAAQQLTAVVKQGNHDVQLKGVDENGDVLRGNNEEMSIRVPIDVSRDPAKAARTMMTHFAKLLDQGLVTAVKASNTVRARLKTIMSGGDGNGGGTVI